MFSFNVRHSMSCLAGLSLVATLILRVMQ